MPKLDILPVTDVVYTDPSRIYFLTERAIRIWAAADTLEAALAIASETLRERHDAWWSEFWSRSRIRLEGDEDAEYLTRLRYLFHYQMAISSRGQYPAKFNGGSGIMERDLRSWQLLYVW